MPVTDLEAHQPYLRGAPPGLPFRLDAETVRRVLNFPLTARLGVAVFGLTCRCLGLRKLIEVCVLFLAAGISAAQSPTRAVEERYNRLRSLKAEFEERVLYSGRVRQEERGTLYLLRPGKMRWEYTQPAGKLFVADGKMFYLYSPNSNQVRRIKPRDAADWRAPLAFLLGRLDFSKEFGPITIRQAGDLIELVAQPRSDRDPFSDVVFHVAPRTYEIRRIRVTGRDGVATEFVFRGEQVNPALDTRLFRFAAPPGAEVLDAEQ